MIGILSELTGRPSAGRVADTSQSPLEYLHLLLIAVRQSRPQQERNRTLKLGSLRRV